MKNIAESRLVCECGSSALVPAFLPNDRVTVCAECARAFRVVLVPIPWSSVERAFSREPQTLAEFEWLRGRVSPGRRRTIEDTYRRTFPLQRKIATALSGVMVVVFALVVCRAVFR